MPPKLTDNLDGSYTFDPGDGSAPTTIGVPSGPDCCPSLVDNGDGTYTYNQNDGSAPITLSTHPALTLTNNQDLAATTTRRITLDTVNQILNVPPPLYAVISVANDGSFVPGDGSLVPINTLAIGQTTYGPMVAGSGSGASPTGTIVIPRTGRYRLNAAYVVNVDEASPADGYTFGLGITVNGATITRYATPIFSAGRAEEVFGYHNGRKLNAGDVIGITAYSDYPPGATIGNAYLIVEYVEGT
jgi:hypothetical protein